VLKYGGEFPIQEHTWALCINIAVASNAPLSMNVKFNCESNKNVVNCKMINLLTSLMPEKGVTEVPPYNRKH